MGFRPGLKGSLEEILEAGKNQLHHQPPVNTSDAPVQFYDKKISQDVTVRVYTPKEKPNDPVPLGVFGHGGGFCGGDLNSDDKTARYMAEHVPCIVVSIDYRLGPKFKFPTMLDDFETGFNWAYDNAEKLGGDQSKVFAWGCSAGGTLSCGLAKRLAEKGQHKKLIGIMNLAGGTMHPGNVPDHLRDQYKAVEENAVDVPIIDRHVMDTFNRAINANPHDTDYTPALSKNLKDFPKTYSVACGLDPLRDDAIIMDSELKKAGVPTKIDIYPGLPHIFWVFDGLPSTKIFYENILEGANFILS
ncbi:alpha/beta-hydrolase [Hyaloscypha variabilis F]|uniref:Alpha/beta-hydrolase n=1 Tax=Hyaloscypha variabilis (strain UAMH 11265 / GT02V1 / F) TaxID=1149755 RepID=A0A2J6S497_HYAVF|nr:alpha/beta-hydrolase [Hyaloscypha variabilis F]